MHFSFLCVCFSFSHPLCCIFTALLWVFVICLLSSFSFFSFLCTFLSFSHLLCCMFSAALFRVPFICFFASFSSLCVFFPFSHLLCCMFSAALFRVPFICFFASFSFLCVFFPFSYLPCAAVITVVFLSPFLGLLCSTLLFRARHLFLFMFLFCACRFVFCFTILPVCLLITFPLLLAFFSDLLPCLGILSSTLLTDLKWYTVKHTMNSHLLLPSSKGTFSQPFKEKHIQ